MSGLKAQEADSLGHRPRNDMIFNQLPKRVKA